MPDDNPLIPANVLPLTGADREALLRQLLERSGFPMADQPGPVRGFFDELSRPELLPRPEEVRQLTVRVDLDGAKPPIWRRLVLAGDLTLDRLHEVLQVAMGWTDSHLHQFTMGPGARDHQKEPFLTDDAEDDGEEGIPERDVRLDEVVAEPGHRLYYEYDFGDGWDHTVKVESVSELAPDAPAARCIAGTRACPPEDVGGIGGYEELVAALDDGDAHDEWVQERLDRLPDGFDPAGFDLAETDEEVRRVAAGGTASGLPPLDALAEGLRQFIARLDGEGASYAAACVTEGFPGSVEVDQGEALAITGPWRLLVDLVGDGLQLTGAGYLPPAVVVALREALFEREMYGKGNREQGLPPVRDLRESATRFGLVRKAKGRLAPTAAARKLAADPVALVHHMARRLPLGRADHQIDAGWVALLQAAAGHERDRDALGRVLGGIGWRVGDQPPTYEAAPWARPTAGVLSLAGWNPDGHFVLRHDPRARKLAQLALRA